MKGIQSRIFLVGCARSGTTLLQALLAAHPQVASFPETMFFRLLVGEPLAWWRGRPPVTAREKLLSAVGRLRERLGLAHPKARQRVHAFLAEVGRPDLESLFPGRGRSIGAQAAAFVGLLDRLTAEEGKAAWVEKSPDHLAYIDLIERYAGPARFVHLVRNGADVVASLYDAARKYPGTHWEAYFGTVDRCIAHWSEAIRLTRRVGGRPNHCVVTYERLVADPAAVLAELCPFLGVPFEEAMLQNYASAARQVVRGSTRWREGVFGPIRDANATKFLELFDEGQRRHILERLSPYPGQG